MPALARWRRGIALQFTLGMQLRSIMILALIPACATGRNSDRGGPGIGIATGVVTAPDEGPTTGMEFHAYGGASMDNLGVPNAYGIAARQLGDSWHYGLQVGWQGMAGPVFGRLMVDMLAWQQVNGERQLSGLSPTLDVGIMPTGQGVCLSGSATWDVRLNEPDRLIVGVFFGLCRGRLD